MLTEKELKELLDVPEAERTADQKTSLATFLTAAGRKSDDKEPAKRDTPDTWDEIFKHPRFKELNQQAVDAKARADALEKAAQDAENKALEESNNFKKLYEKAQAEITGLKPKAEQLDSMEKTLGALLEAQVKDLPEQFQDIVPDGLNTQQKLDWLGKNKAKFMRPEGFDIGAGSNGAKPNKQKATDLTPEEKQLARDFGMTEIEYASHKDKEVPAA